MKKFVLLTIIITRSLCAQVGINTANPSEASVLDIEAVNSGGEVGGLLLPRVSLSERNAIPVTPVDDGLMIFLIEGTTRCLQLYDASATPAVWRNVYCMPLNQAPEALDVTFQGTLQVGNTLEGSYTYTDNENNPEGVSQFQWYRADDFLGTNLTAIPGATAITYTLQTADLDKYISFSVKPVATQGTTPGDESFSSYQGPIAADGSGGVIISEIADPNNNINARFLELTNRSTTAINIGNWVIRKYVNGSATNIQSFTIPDGTVINEDQSFVFSNNQAEFLAVYGFEPNFSRNTQAGVFGSNGDDVIEILNSLGERIDIYGAIGTDGTGTCAEFEDGRALRSAGIINGVNTWNEGQWIVRADSTIPASQGCTNHANDPQNAPVATDPGDPITGDFTPGTHPN